MSDSESRHKTQLVQVRCTPDEKSALRDRASDFGVSVGELCRRTLFGALPKTRLDQKAILELAQLRGDLGRMGGLLKGWLAGSFEQKPPALRSHTDVVNLLRQIEATQKAVLETLGKVGK